LLIPLKPRRIALYFGENDIASDGLTAHTIFEHFKELRERISHRLPITGVFVLGIKPSPARWIYQQEFSQFNALARDGCKTCDRTEWIDPSAGLMGENGLPMFRFYLPDLVHMNTAGYAGWAKALLKCCAC
jgi:lysophospholipase L1-like esterase